MYFVCLASMSYLFKNTDFHSVVPEECIYATVKMAVDDCCHLLNKPERSSVSLDLDEHPSEEQIITHRKTELI